MHEVVEAFKVGVYEQAILNGFEPQKADKIAAQAVLDRLNKSEAGYAVAQTDNFTPITVYNYEFQLTNVRVDQAMGTGLVVEALLGSTELDSAGQKFSEEALEEFAEQINAGGLGGYLDEHRGFRVTKERFTHDAVTEWVKARVEHGQLWITTKLKTGFEWIIDKYSNVSLEAIVPKTKTLIQGNIKTFLGGFLKGFVFTNNPKQTMHRIVDSFQE